MALLGMVTAVIVTALNSVVAGQTSGQKRLGAAEVANRLLIQYLDDESSMPSRTAPVGYGPDFYRWRMTETPIVLEPARTDERAARTRTPRSFQSLKNVTVEVWLAEQSGGSFEPDSGTPSVMLSRIVDPLAFRNMDSFERLRRDPERFRRYIEQFTGGDSSPVQSPSSRPGSPRRGEGVGSK